MQVQEFGTALVQRGDLDPIYLMLNGGGLDSATVRRWSLAYWMFYHAGVASRIAEGKPKQFWSLVQQAQEEKWPRGTERRHFKGAQSQKAINELRGAYNTAEQAVADLIGPHEIGAMPFLHLWQRAQRWRGFGPWIAFKMCDMTDAVLGIPVDFSRAGPYLFDDPVKGAVWVHAQELGHDDSGNVEGLKNFHASLTPSERLECLYKVLAEMPSWFKGLTAPHAPHRALGVQEFETILCKYKSHLNGHYPVGKDTKEILHGLADGRWGGLAQQLHTSLAKATAQ